jgi:hypothetical protein
MRPNQQLLHEPFLTLSEPSSFGLWRSARHLPWRRFWPTWSRASALLPPATVAAIRSSSLTRDRVSHPASLRMEWLRRHLGRVSA